MRATARVSSKGQVVIPASMRKRHGIKSGSTVVFEDTKGKLVIETNDPWEELFALRGSLSGHDLEGELMRMRAQERRREEEKLRQYR